MVTPVHCSDTLRAWIGAVTAEGRVNDGAWHHVAVAVDSGAVSFYVDGQARGGGALDTTQTRSRWSFRKGARLRSLPL